MDKQTSDRTLRQVLSQGNAEQNQHYPMHVFDSHYNIVTSFIIDEGVKVFGTNNYIRNLLRPYYAVKRIPVIYGQAELPQDYRHYTSVGIYVEENLTGCVKIDGLQEGEVPNDDQLKEFRAKQQVKYKNLEMVEVDEYDDLSDHSYKAPTFEDPIGCIFESNSIKVAPYGVPFIELRYLRQPKSYRYGYSVNLDDSYSWDPKMEGAVETEWGTNADALLFKGVSTLYSIYVRDGELRDGNAELKKLGMF